MLDGSLLTCSTAPRHSGGKPQHSAWRLAFTSPNSLST